MRERRERERERGGRERERERERESRERERERERVRCKESAAHVGGVGGRRDPHPLCASLLCRHNVRIGVHRLRNIGVPHISWTILGLTFLEQSNVAHLCRKEWKVKPESPALLSSGLKPRW